jgi:hypothetical protein
MLLRMRRSNAAQFARALSRSDCQTAKSCSQVSFLSRRISAGAFRSPLRLRSRKSTERVFTPLSAGARLHSAKRGSASSLPREGAERRNGACLSSRAPFRGARTGRAKTGPALRRSTAVSLRALGPLFPPGPEFRPDRQGISGSTRGCVVSRAVVQGLPGAWLRAMRAGTAPLHVQLRLENVPQAKGMISNYSNSKI